MGEELICEPCQSTLSWDSVRKHSSTTVSITIIQEIQNFWPTMQKHSALVRHSVTTAASFSCTYRLPGDHASVLHTCSVNGHNVPKCAKAPSFISPDFQDKVLPPVLVARGPSTIARDLQHVPSGFDLLFSSEGRGNLFLRYSYMEVGNKAASCSASCSSNRW